MKAIAQNRKARHDYEILETLEVGIELFGTEVKSIREGKVSLADSYGIFSENELFIQHLHINIFEQGNRFNHTPYRKRKLLLHKSELLKMRLDVERKHLAVIPLSLYMKKQWVKLEIGLCKARKKYDKREKIAKEESKRRIAQVMKARNR